MLTLDRFLVTGGEGRIGASLNFGQRPKRTELDVTSATQWERAMKAYRPEGILHLASLDIYRSQRDPRQCREINEGAVTLAGRAAAERGIPFVYLSSGAVFSGEERDVFRETAVPAPLSEYGKCKRQAEQWITANLKNYLILRTGWVFGTRHSTRPCLVENFLRRLQRAEPVYLDAIHRGSPTALPDLVGAMTRFVGEGRSGVIHVVNSEAATAESIWREVVALAGRPDRSARLEQREGTGPWPPRSRSEVLASDFLTLRPWREALREYFA